MQIIVNVDPKTLATSVKTKSTPFLEGVDSFSVFLWCLAVIFTAYIVIVFIEKYPKQTEGSCCVDVYLEKNEPVKEIPPPEKSKLARIFNTGKKVNLSEKEFNCLSRNIYWESLREPLIGQIAVATITHNRVKSKKWGNSFCKVVFAPKQFSWTNFDKIRNATPKNKNQWKRAKHSAMLFTKGVRVTTLENSRFYYADYIKPPVWSKKMTKTAKIGTHIFFADNK